MKDRREIEKLKLLNRIIERGTLWAAITKQVIENKYDANQFLIECYEQCKGTSLQQLWGIELIDDIIDYNVKYNGKSETIEPYTITINDNTYTFQYNKTKLT